MLKGARLFDANVEIVFRISDLILSQPMDIRWSCKESTDKNPLLFLFLFLLQLLLVGWFP